MQHIWCFTILSQRGEILKHKEGLFILYNLQGETFFLLNLFFFSFFLFCAFRTSASQWFLNLIVSRMFVWKFVEFSITRNQNYSQGIPLCRLTNLHTENITWGPAKSRLPLCSGSGIFGLCVYICLILWSVCARKSIHTCGMLYLFAETCFNSVYWGYSSTTTKKKKCRLSFRLLLSHFNTSIYFDHNHFIRSLVIKLGLFPLLL